ncbi:MAG: riboflavin synthase [Alphaproteobacteria bacterium]|nr:riboflavin synthase [Alphaproteobacteria bacterium]
MFTGIITDVGRVIDIRREAKGDARLKIATKFQLAETPLGASIACAGCCLTVVEKGGDWFAVDVSNETLSKTTLGGWAAGDKVNLERPLKMGDELGGHLVTGHVDGVAKVIAITPDGDSRRITIEVPAHLARFIAAKGSVAVDGVSLTVNDVIGASFGVNIIPHTQTVTTLGGLKSGDPANVEIDLLARYVARLNENPTP